MDLEEGNSFDLEKLNAEDVFFCQPPHPHPLTGMAGSLSGGCACRGLSLSPASLDCPSFAL